jgi:enterochelin esterase-like enzyme
MKKKFLLLLTGVLFLMAGLTLQAQWTGRGKVIEGIVFHSKLMGDVRYTIYLPPGYDRDERRYPVIYMLHGYSDDDTGWLQFGEADRIAGEAINRGEMPPAILVMPDGKVTWYVNDYKKEEPWQEMFVTEFIPYIDKTYRTRPKKEFRGILGLSMGGYGALHIAMRHPDLFTASVAFSSGTLTDEEVINMPEQDYLKWFGTLFGENLKGKKRISENWKAFSPLHLLDSQPMDKLKSVRWYLDIGDDDFLYKGNAALHVKMREIGLPHEFRMRDGNHSWIYWRTGLLDGFLFISKSFNR